MTNTIEWCITYPVGDWLHGRVYIEADSQISIEDLLSKVTPEHIDNTDVLECQECTPDMFHEGWVRKDRITVYDEIIDDDVYFYLAPDKGWECEVPDPIDGYQTHFVK
jgi:hypothetical protein